MQIVLRIKLIQTTLLQLKKKKSAVDKIDKALARAINQVNILHTHKYVDLIKREMKQKIGEASVVKNKIKDTSKKVIDEELKKQFKIINEADDSTMEEKNKAIESAKKEAEKAKKKILIMRKQILKFKRQRMMELLKFINQILSQK